MVTNITVAPVASAQATNYVPEAALSLPALSWATVPNAPAVTATARSVQLPLTGPAQLFRLVKPQDRVEAEAGSTQQETEESPC